LISVKIKSRCLTCGFEVEWEARTNEYGFFEIPDAYCPNDYCMLDQVIDSRDKENADKRRP